MRLRHAAMLAIVGWYLILPRVTEEFGRPTFDAKAPLSEWTIYGTIPGGLRFQGYDTLSDCEQMKEFVKNRAQKDLPSSGSSPMMTEQGFALSTKYAICVSTDDPRLKK